MNDFLDEELQIMNEQDSARTTLDSNTFKRPIEDMNFPKPICLDVSSTLGEAIDIMQSKSFGSILITKDDIIEGILTERDILLKVIGKDENWRSANICEYMTHNPLCLQKGDEIAYVLNNMHVGGYRHVPIIDKDRKPIGIVSIKDITSFILDHFNEEVTNLTGEPYRGPVSRESA